ncbi:MAG: PspC domain-containing protein [Allosphingosinicella sp.]
MSSSNIFTRDDTLFGVCQALGEDLGFNPNWLRVALAATVLWNPVAVLGIYAALGILVVFTRWIAPTPRATAPAEAAILTEANDGEAERLPIAA